MTREELESEVSRCEKALYTAKQKLEAFDDAIENYVFETLDDAADEIEYALRVKASTASGKNCWGDDEYRRPFIVDGVKYVGILKCEYNRFDKTYYYLDSSSFSYKKLDED